MTTLRLLALAAVLLLVGAAVVILRAEQARLAHQTASLEHRATRLQRTLWRQQLEIARLRSPASVRQRVENMRIAAHPLGGLED